MVPASRLSGLPPVAGPTPRVLVLGSFPSRLSLKRAEYFANPRNRFWPLMEALLGIPADLPYRERAGLLSSRGVALWDVVGSCSREGSGDSAIRDPVVNDIPGFIRAYPSLSLVILNGGTAGRLFHRILGTGLPPSLRVVILPSTSPANARFTLPKLAGRWSILRGFTRE